MTKIGIIKEIYERSPYICMIVDDDINHAQNLAKDYARNTPIKNCQYWIRTVSENACIGDQL